MINGTIGQDEAINTVNARPWKKIIMGLLLMAIVTCFSLPTLSRWVDGIPSIDANSITLARVFKGTLIRDIAVNGKLVAADAPTLYSSESGQITLLAKPGDIVQKGTVVAVILSPELQSASKQATAKLERLKIESSRGELIDREAQLDLKGSQDTAQVAYNTSVRELTRSEIAFKKQVISEFELATKRDTKIENALLFKHAKKRVELALKRLAFENKTREFSIKSQQLVVDELQRRIQLLKIRAPVTGVVGNWLVQKKEHIKNTQAIMTIVDLSQYEAELNVPEFYANDLGLGLDVQIKISGKSLIGKISSISPEIKSNQVLVRVSIANIAKMKLRQNQQLNARIEFEKKENVLIVKRGVFLTSHAGKSAYLIKGDRAENKPISIGSQSVEFIEIKSGLKDGDEIIISSTADFDKYPTLSLD